MPCNVKIVDTAGSLFYEGVGSYGENHHRHRRQGLDKKLLGSLIEPLYVLC